MSLLVSTDWGFPIIQRFGVNQIRHLDYNHRTKEAAMNKATAAADAQAEIVLKALLEEYNVPKAVAELSEFFELSNDANVKSQEYNNHKFVKLEVFNPKMAAGTYCDRGEAVYAYFQNISLKSKGTVETTDDWNGDRPGSIEISRELAALYAQTGHYSYGIMGRENGVSPHISVFKSYKNGEYKFRNVGEYTGSEGIGYSWDYINWDAKDKLEFYAWNPSW